MSGTVEIPSYASLAIHGDTRAELSLGVEPSDDPLGKAHVVMGLKIFNSGGVLLSYLSGRVVELKQVPLPSKPKRHNVETCSRRASEKGCPICDGIELELELARIRNGDTAKALPTVVDDEPDRCDECSSDPEFDEEACEFCDKVHP